jgi:hypothetical protein
MNFQSIPDVDFSPKPVTTNYVKVHSIGNVLSNTHSPINKGEKFATKEKTPPLSPQVAKRCKRVPWTKEVSVQSVVFVFDLCRIATWLTLALLLKQNRKTID